jgi:hypothetical protein
MYIEVQINLRGVNLAKNENDDLLVDFTIF